MAATLQDILDRNKKKAAGNKQRTVKPKQGKSVWRILPGWNPKEPNEFVQAFGQHFIKDPDGKVKMVLGCPDKTFDEPCEVCDAIQEAARNAPTDKAREKILESRATQRFLFNAVSSEDPSKVEILEVGSMLFNDIVANISEDESLIDAEEGRDFVITREGSGMNTRYSLATRSKAKSMSVPKSALMELNNLREYVTEDFEAKKKKALTALGVTAGKVLSGSGAAGALAAPDDIDIDDDDLEDDIPDFDARKEAEKELSDEGEADVEDADVEYDDAGSDDDDDADEKKAAEESYGDDISDDDIESMLADLD